MTDKKPVSEKPNEENNASDSKIPIEQGNIGFLTIKLLAEINDKLALLLQRTSNG